MQEEEDTDQHLAHLQDGQATMTTIGEDSLLQLEWILAILHADHRLLYTLIAPVWQAPYLVLPRTSMTLEMNRSMPVMLRMTTNRTVIRLNLRLGQLLHVMARTIVLPQVVHLVVTLPTARLVPCLHTIEVGQASLLLRDLVEHQQALDSRMPLVTSPLPSLEVEAV